MRRSRRLPVRFLLLAMSGLHGLAAGPTAAQVVATDTSDNAAGLEVSVSPPSPVPLGASLQFAVSARRRGYLLLVTIAPDGGATQIYPSFGPEGLPFGATDESNALAANRPVVLPNPRNPLGSFELFAKSTGSNAVIALLSSSQVQLVDLADITAAAHDVPAAVHGVFDKIKELRVAPRNPRAALAQPHWSMTAFIYSVE